MARSWLRHLLDRLGDHVVQDRGGRNNAAVHFRDGFDEVHDAHNFQYPCSTRMFFHVDGQREGS